MDCQEATTYGKTILGSKWVFKKKKEQNDLEEIQWVFNSIMGHRTEPLSLLKKVLQFLYIFDKDFSCVDAKLNSQLDSDFARSNDDSSWCVMASPVVLSLDRYHVMD